MKETIISYILKALGALMIILAPIKAAMILVFSMILLDMFFGIWSAIVRGHRINSRTMFRTVSKLFVWEFTIIMTFLIELYLTPGIPISKTILMLAGIIEGKSIFENLYIITKIDFLKILINFFQIQRKNVKFGGDDEQKK